MTTKKLILFEVLLMLIVLSCTSKRTEDGFEIIGQTTGDYKGYIYLGLGDDYIDSFYITDNHFILKGKVDHPVPGYLLLEPRTTFQSFRLENSKIKVRAKLSVDERDNQAILNRIKIDTIIGSKGEQLYKDLRLFYDNYFSMDTTSEAMNTILYEKLKSFALENPEHYLSGWTIGQAENLSAIQIKELFELIDEEAQWKDDLENIKSLIRRGELYKTGEDFVGFHLPDTSNQLVNTTDLKGSILLYEIWASWCRPCRQKNPSLNKLQKKYADEGFKIVGVSLDSDKGKWINAIHKDSIAWIHLSNLKGWNNELRETYGINKLPFNILVNKEGKMVDIDLDLLRLESKLVELIKD